MPVATTGVRSSQSASAAAASRGDSSSASLTPAPNGRTALDVLHKEQRIDLLFTDFAMPGGINGRDLAVEAVAQRPQIKILLTSAYTEQLTAAKNPVPSMRFLSKPYREGELALAVRSTLDEG